MHSKYKLSSKSKSKQRQKQNKKTTGRENKETKKPENRTENRNTPLPYIPNLSYTKPNKHKTKQNQKYIMSMKSAFLVSRKCQ